MIAQAALYTERQKAVAKAGQQHLIIFQQCQHHLDFFRTVSLLLCFFKSVQQLVIPVQTNHGVEIIHVLQQDPDLTGIVEIKQDRQQLIRPPAVDDHAACLDGGIDVLFHPVVPEVFRHRDRTRRSHCRISDHTVTEPDQHIFMIRVSSQIILKLKEHSRPEDVDNMLSVFDLPESVVQKLCVQIASAIHFPQEKFDQFPLAQPPCTEGDIGQDMSVKS